MQRALRVARIKLYIVGVTVDAYAMVGVTVDVYAMVRVIVMVGI